MKDASVKRARNVMSRSSGCSGGLITTHKQNSRSMARTWMLLAKAVTGSHWLRKPGSARTARTAIVPVMFTMVNSVPTAGDAIRQILFET